MKNLKTFRHEYKYYINYIEYESLRRRLAAVLKNDSNANRQGEYHIRSLYFDDDKNSALYEKQAGILARRKFRIRIYNINDDVIKLEKKCRVGQFIRKESAAISREDYENIRNRKIAFLKHSNSQLLKEFYRYLSSTALKPVVIVDYVREAYLSKINNIRITFDKQLRSGLNRLELFDKNLLTVDVIERPVHILEIKYDHFLPDYIRGMLQLSSNQRYAISKYVICRKFTKFNNWEDN